jgi:membrane protease YdiL (CAAX protease family)
MIEVVCVFLGMALALGFCFTLAIVIAHTAPGLRGMRPAELATDPRVILPAQLAAYLMVFGALWRLFAHHLRIGFLRALLWNWPQRWPMFVAGGVLLAVAVQVGSHLLPAPPELPIEKMFSSALDAWMMSIFGVFVAPFVEEVLFRGLLFPALARRAGVLLSLVVTSLLFGAMHATQLGGAWIQVSFIVLVGVVLTVVRWRSRSLACSTLVHVGYNGLLFAALFVQTRGFTQFPLR